MVWSKFLNTVKGGPGSGNFGHAGRPGKRGGSASRAGGIGAGKKVESTPAKKGESAADFLSDDLLKGADYDKKVFRKAMEDIPASHIQNPDGSSKITGVNLVMKDRASAEWEEAAGQRAPSFMITGFAEQDGGVTVATGRLRKDVAKTTVHEVGHIVFGEKTQGPAQKAVTKVKKNTDALFKARNRQDGERGWAHRAVSDYAMANSSEYRSELYATFVGSPDLLKRRDPEGYAIMSTFFKETS